ncbi:Predicted N-acyltransferase, GNAT family [Ekhidna lutea]|uniref:Predicted N-acyltransferase, GNAT family n=1 Tax=Ekhidna lutea TaxID=447679 RepID=A0A239KG92_EKHLU|nr:GNAT family N-acetyltransferase [Ekhidna lutea]SNT16722.1 Predicted N-acyltransferase, GNAT family [Ekhidna lutea]
MTFRVIPATSKELKDKSFAIREEVFVVEQQVAHDEEFDEFEDESHHFVALDENDNPIGSARWRYTDKGIKLERFTAKQNWRGKGLGTAIVKAVMDHISQTAQKGTYLYLHAQLHAVPLYLKFGFQTEGDQFDECGIMHYLMWRKL